MKITNFRLAIGFPCSWPTIPFPFFQSFIHMERPDFIPIIATNGPIDGLRNKIVQHALSIRASHLIMMDLDQIYPVDTITKLLKHNLPVVGCKVHRRYPPFDPLMLKGEINHYQVISEWEPGELVEVDATGTGCLMINMDVFHKLPMPWFRFRQNPDPDYASAVGEDVGFCYDLRKIGYKIYVDTSIECGHLSTMVIEDSVYTLYQLLSLKKKQQEVRNGY